MTENIHLGNDVARRYFEYWVVALSHLFGWDRDRVVRWARKYEAELNDENSLLYRERPSWEVAVLFIPEKIKASEAPGLIPLWIVGRVDGALRMEDHRIDAVRSYDWEAARKRIDDILREFGSSFEEVCHEHP